MKRRWNQIKRVPWWGWCFGIGYFALQRGMYRLGEWLSRALGTVAWAFECKIPVIDDLFPVVPAWTVIYVFISYLFWIAGPVAASLTKKRNFVNYIVGLSLGYFVGFLFFAFMPTMMDRVKEGLMSVGEQPGFFNGLLDQGYWSDGLYTPAGPEAYEKDILTMKSLGFNTLRKHIKIEPEQFYYDCDRFGMIVFQDMVNNGEYHYGRDTVLPTVGICRCSDQRMNPDPETRKIFLKTMEGTVCHLRNHPSICLWTIFNEGWGQFCADEAYSKLRAMDCSRFIDSTSGWFHQNVSDVDSLHIYFRKLRLGTEDRPQLLSEFGGYSYKIPEHSFNLKKTYGYRKYQNREQFVKGLQDLYTEVEYLAENGLSGAIYTQVSDVEDETNGLFTFDRKVLKIRPDELLPIMEKINRNGK